MREHESERRLRRGRRVENNGGNSGTGSWGTGKRGKQRNGGLRDRENRGKGKESGHGGHVREERVGKMGSKDVDGMNGASDRGRTESTGVC